MQYFSKWRLATAVCETAIVCEGENCTTIIIELFVIFCQFGSHSFAQHYEVLVKLRNITGIT
jgi:hypothetical protein